MSSFEKAPEEPLRAYDAFVAYADLGPGRSLRQLSEATGMSASTLGHYSAKFRWRERLAEAKTMVARARLERGTQEWDERHERMCEEEWQLRQELVEESRKALRRWKESRAPVRMETILKMLERASALGRQACEGPVKRPEGDPQVQVDIALALEKAYGEAADGQATDAIDVESTTADGREGERPCQNG